MVKVELIRGRNSKTKKVVVSLFADKRDDLISGQEIHGMPDGYSIDFGSSCETANGEMAYLKSDCATWVWVKVDPTTITLEELDVTENGEYTAESGKAYTPVIVQIPLGNKTVNANGTYTATDDNLQGYSEVTVEVPDPELITKSITDNGTYNAEDDNADGYSQVSISVSPNVDSKEINDNGTYTASSESLDGYSSVVVDVQPDLTTKTVSENGTYQAADDNADGYSEFTVEVPSPDLQTKNISTNGTYYAYDDNVDGYDQVEVNVTPDLITLDADHNGQYKREGSLSGYSEVNVSVQPNVTTKSITDNGTYSASDEGYDGYSEVDVNVSFIPHLDSLDVDHNSVYEFSGGCADGWGTINVNVPQSAAVVDTLEATENGRTYIAGDDNLDGYSEVTVNVPTPNYGTLSATENKTYYAYETEHDGYDQVDVNVTPDLIDIYVRNNGSYDPSPSSSSYTHDGYSFVTVDVKHTIKFTTSEPPTNVSFADEEDTAHLIIMIPNESESAYRSAENFPNDAEYIEYDPDED